MECSTYVCPKCRRTFRIKGADRNLKCADCQDTYLKDMHIDADLWKTFNLGKQTQTVDRALSGQDLEKEYTTADKAKSYFCSSCGAPLTTDVKFCPNCGEKNIVFQAESVTTASTESEPQFSRSTPVYQNNEAQTVGDINVYIEPEGNRKPYTIMGIISCALAITAFFINPTFMGLLLGLVSLILAVYAIRKKCNLQGFPVITVIIESLVITVSIIAVLITKNINVLFDDSVLTSFIDKETGTMKSTQVSIQDSTQERTKESSTESTEETAYECGGMTFFIPSYYKYNSQSDGFKSKNGIIKIQKIDTTLSDEVFSSSAAKLDELIESNVKEAAPNLKFTDSRFTEVAGCSARECTYRGMIDSNEYIGHFMVINNTSSQSLIYFGHVSAVTGNQTATQEFNELIATAQNHGTYSYNDPYQNADNNDPGISDSVDASDKYVADYDASTFEHEYYLNLGTGVFHEPSCYKVKEINNGTYVYATFDEMISQGYEGCGICNPD
ncbi:MAG: zinc ribbon domain-containing protein [Lachnospiraceae bacterium]|nr:zinc ribbon domain-containing protein [Lachnospiraceae bacterium]